LPLAGDEKDKKKFRFFEKSADSNFLHFFAENDERNILTNLAAKRDKIFSEKTFHILFNSAFFKDKIR
jgi:hypothetical protein